MKLTLNPRQRAEIDSILKNFEGLEMRADRAVSGRGLTPRLAPPPIPDSLAGVLDPDPSGGVPNVTADLTEASIAQVGTLHSYWSALFDYYRDQGVHFDAVYEVARERLGVLKDQLSLQYITAGGYEASNDDVAVAARMDPAMVHARAVLLEAKITRNLARSRVSRISQTLKLISREISRRDIVLRSLEGGRDEARRDMGSGRGRRAAKTSADFRKSLERVHRGLS